MENSQFNIGKVLIILGIVLVIAGLTIHFFNRIPFLGKLPGDILIERKNFRLYFPLTTSILISLLLTLILFLVNRFRH